MEQEFKACFVTVPQITAFPYWRCSREPECVAGSCVSTAPCLGLSAIPPSPKQRDFPSTSQQNYKARFIDAHKALRELLTE